MKRITYTALFVVVIAFILAAVSASQSSLDTPKYPKWEHAEWRDYYSEGKSAWITGKDPATVIDTYELYTQLGGNEPIERYRIASYATTILDQASVAGWELCAGYDMGNTRYFFFKRPIK